MARLLGLQATPDHDAGRTIYFRRISAPWLPSSNARFPHPSSRKVTLAFLYEGWDASRLSDAFAPSRRVAFNLTVPQLGYGPHHTAFDRLEPVWSGRFLGLQATPDRDRQVYLLTSGESVPPGRQPLLRQAPIMNPLVSPSFLGALSDFRR